MAGAKRVWLVGLGTIARTHGAALSSRADVHLVCGLDPGDSPAVDADFPVHPSLDAALAVEPPPDLVVVATPSRTHVDLVDVLLEKTDALLLSEKPLADTRAELQVLLDRHPADVLAG